VVVVNLAFWRRREERVADLSGFIGPRSPFVMGGLSSFTGRAIDAERAINGTVAVYACVSLIADTIGALPLKTYRRSAPDAREIIDSTTALPQYRGTGYPGTLARVLGELPNPEMTAQELWSGIIGHLCLWGNAYCQVVRDASGRPQELWPLRPDRMEPRRDPATQELVYIYRLESGAVRMIPRDLVMHIRGLSVDGQLGISPIHVARNAIALEQAGVEYGGRFFTNSATPSSIVTIPKAGNKFGENVKITREGFEGLYGGLNRAQRMAVIEEGTSWQQVGMNNTDAQFIEMRGFQIAEVARLFRVPPHLIGDVTKESSWGTGIEQMTIGFLTYTLSPYLQRIEQGVNRDLGLVPGVKTLSDEKLYVEFDVRSLLRSDIKTRYEAYGIGIEKGFLLRSDVRGWENLDPVEGLEKPLRPANLMTPEQEAKPIVEKVPVPGAPQDMPMLKAVASKLEELQTELRRSDDRAELYRLADYRNAPAPATNDVHVHIPEQLEIPATVVPAPVVTVNVPEQAAPVVTVNVPEVVLPKPDVRKRKFKVNRNAEGRIEGVEDV